MTPDTQATGTHPVDDGPTLEDQYRAALLDHSGGYEERQRRIKAIEQQIIADRGEERAIKLMDSVAMDVEHEGEIDAARRSLQDSLKATETASGQVRAALRRLTELYDIEVAEGQTAETAAALMNIDLNLAALRHFLRYAMPEDRER